MDSKLLQTLRYRLQNRVRRLKAAEWDVYHWQLVQFWTFLNSHALFRNCLQFLEGEKSEVLNRVQPIIEVQEQFSPSKHLAFEHEKDQAAASYFVIKACVEKVPRHKRDQKELYIGHLFDGSDLNRSITAFTEKFVMPLYEYLDEQLDSRNVLLYLLVRYKHISEWFRTKDLLGRYNEAKDFRKGEKVPAADMYEFLYSQGLDFHIEPESATGEIDLISEQVGDDRLLVDAKVFSGSTSNIKDGFHQIYTYTATYNQPCGCLAIFNVSDKQLCFSSQHADPKFGVFSVNGKTLFMITIDISGKPSASKRGTLKQVVLTEQDLIQSLQEESPED